MKVLLLGASGFLGSNFLKNLKSNKYEFLCLSRSPPRLKRFKFKRCDLNNTSQFKKIVEKFKPNICLDLSWQGIPNYTKKNNLFNFSNKKKIYNILASYKCEKIISIGSCWEYGDLKKKVKENNNSKIKLNNFAESKIKILNFLKKLNKTNNIKFIWGRLFFVYGPYAKKTSLLENLIFHYKVKKKFNLKNTTGCNDFIYVRDACNIIKDLTFKNLKSGIYNIGSGNCSSNLEFLNTFLKVLKLKYKLKFHPKKECLRSDNSKIYRNISYRVNYNLTKGIKETLKVYNIIY